MAFPSSKGGPGPEGMEQVAAVVEGLDPPTAARRAELLVRFLRIAPGWKEANFMVMNKLLAVLPGPPRRMKQ